LNFLMRFGIFAFLQRETHALNRKLLVLTLVSGIANAMNLAVINAAVDALRGGGPSWQHFVWFGLSIALFVYSLRYILYESTRLTEAAICSVRLRLADKIRRSDLLALETIGEGDIHARISRDTAAISQAARPLFAAAQGVVMILFTIAYIGAVSPVAMMLCLILIAAGAVKYFEDRAAYDRGLQESSRREDVLSESLNGLLRGFKEVRINQRKSADVFAEFESTTVGVRDVRTRVLVLFSNNILFIEMFFVLLLGAVAFVLPVLATAFSSSATKIVAAILFFFGPLSTVVSMVPVLAQVNVTVANLQGLEASLDEALAQSAGNDAAPEVDLSSFHAIRFDGVGFTYRDPDGNATFQVGPIDGEVRRGEVLFLVGGNGSGKTSFLKLFTALYRPAEGIIRVDDLEIGPANIQSYRNLFSAIFSDFYLFEKLHGLSDAPPERINALLDVMGLSGKTAYLDGRFTTTHLSTGQRKRLALVVACLEDKPVYVFDEVAADQDAHFRGYFYETLLPELKRNGKTIVVVTHDDRYFHIADRVLGMDYGKFRGIEPPVVKRAKPRKQPPGR
jgi:putative pyoverdin transport system ATP-binding/permease protein